MVSVFVFSLLTTYLQSKRRLWILFLLLLLLLIATRQKVCVRVISAQQGRGVQGAACRLWGGKIRNYEQRLFQHGSQVGPPPLPSFLLAEMLLWGSGRLQAGLSNTAPTGERKTQRRLAEY